MFTIKKMITNEVIGQVYGGARDGGKVYLGFDFDHPISTKWKPEEAISKPAKKAASPLVLNLLKRI